MNKFDEMRIAVRDAENTVKACDSVATDMARLLLGRLKHVDSSYTLAALKKELQNFDAHKKEWKK